MNEQNKFKRVYLVERDNFNRKVCQTNMFVAFVGGSLIAMLFKYKEYGYITCDYYVGGEYVELTAKDEEQAQAIEENFKGRWAE